MTTILTATARFAVPYTVGSQTHVLHAYARNPQLVGSDWKVNSRSTDSNDLLAADAASGLSETMSILLTGSDTFGSILFQTRSGTIWTTVATYSPTSGHGSSATFYTSEYTLVLRDTLLHRFKIIMLDTIEAAPQHFTTVSGGDSPSDSYAKQFTPTHDVTSAPYLWVVSRGNQYISPTGFVAVTVSLNKRVRRARGYV
jgi:hypothetical protein